MSEFIFKEDPHQYFLDGVELPSVTRILNPLYDYSSVSRDVLKRAGDFGTGVHLAVKLYLMDDLDEEGLDDNLVKPLEAFRLWELDYPEIACDLETAAVETPMFHPRLKYAGTADICGETFLIDLKSRPVNLLTDPLQLAAYDNFDKGGRDRYVLELKQDRTYVFTQVDRTMAARKRSFERFRYLLDYYKMGEEIKRWKN